MVHTTSVNALIIIQLLRPFCKNAQLGKKSYSSIYKVLDICELKINEMTILHVAGKATLPRYRDHKNNFTSFANSLYVTCPYKIVNALQQCMCFIGGVIPVSEGVDLLPPIMLIMQVIKT